jgi:hypothetical protein
MATFGAVFIYNPSDLAGWQSEFLTLVSWLVRPEVGIQRKTIFIY